MTQTSPDYVPSEVSVRDAPLPTPSPATRRNRPAIPRNAVMSREHPPLYAGDYNNNLSKNMYWWEKLDANDPEEKRILLAMYYGEERQPRCNVCEKRNRACMWFLGEEDQLNKSCVKCRRVHATCKPAGCMDTIVDDSRLDSETREDTNQQFTSSYKRKASELDPSDNSETSVKRTRSSLQTNSAREPTDHSDVVHVRSQDDQYAGDVESRHQTGFETPSSVEIGWMDKLPLDDDTQVDILAGRASAVDHRDDRLSSITFGETNDLRSDVRVSRQRSQDGFSQIEKGLYALIDERYKSELKSLRAMIKKQAADHQAQLTALRADFTHKDRKEEKEVVGEAEMEKMRTVIEAERAHRRRMEDENIRLKNRLARVEAAQDAGMEDLQDQIKKLREDMSLS
jgi:hypothetical protein